MTTRDFGEVIRRKLDDDPTLSEGVRLATIESECVQKVYGSLLPRLANLTDRLKADGIDPFTCEQIRDLYEDAIRDTAEVTREAFLNESKIK